MPRWQVFIKETQRRRHDQEFCVNAATLEHAFKMACDITGEPRDAIHLEPDGA